MIKGYWLAMVTRVSDVIDRNPEIEMSLNVMVSEVGGSLTLRDTHDLQLPRAGESYWLVDDATFERLVRETL